MKKLFNVIVKESFRDKYSGIKHKAGDRLTVTEERLKELRRKGGLVEVEKTAPTPAPTPKTNEIKK